MMSHNFYALPEPVIIIKWSNCVPDMGPTNPQGFLAHFCHLVDLVFFFFFLLFCFWVACVSNLMISYLVLLMCWVSMSVLLCPVLYNPSILYKWQINEWTKKSKLPVYPCVINRSVLPANCLWQSLVAAYRHMKRVIDADTTDYRTDRIFTNDKTSNHQFLEARGNEIGVKSNRVALEFHRYVHSKVTEASVKYKSNRITKTYFMRLWRFLRLLCSQGRQNDIIYYQKTLWLIFKKNNKIIRQDICRYRNVFQ